MRGNEFEKKVQEQMEDLHFRPSPMVWMEVEKELRKKKRRRIVFFLSMLAGLGLLGYTGYTLLSQNKDTLANQEQNAISPAVKPVGPNDQSHLSSSPVNSNTTTDSKTTTIDPSLLNNDAVADSHEKVKQPDNQPVNKATGQIADHPVQQSIPGGKKANAINAMAAEKTTSQLAVTSVSPAIGNKKAQKDKIAAEQQAPLQTQKETVVVNEQQETKLTKESNSISDNGTAKNSQPVTSPDIAVVDSVKTDSAIAKIDLNTDLPDSAKTEIAIAKNKVSKKIKWGVEISAGKNFSRERPFEISRKSLIASTFNYDLSDLYKNLANLQTGQFGSVSYNLGAGYVRRPSAVKAGRAFKAGVNAELALTKRSSVRAALRYSYQSESIKVGQRIRTTINTNSYPLDDQQSASVPSAPSTPANGLAYWNVTAYYGPEIKEHTNQYHFIELPVSFQLQLNRGRKVQLLWDAGVSVSYLLSTNALVYDTASYGIYYKSPKAYTRVHFGLQSGLSVRFGKASKMQWAIGPELSLDMTRLMKKEFILANRYFMYGGITAKVLLPHKKK